MCDQSVVAQTPQPIFTVKPPPGFETEAGAQQTIVDIVVEGKKLGSTPAHFDFETIRFDDPDGLASLIPAVRDHAAVSAALSIPLAQNRDRACKARPAQSNCDYVEPDPVAVIFDPDSLVAQIFISDIHRYDRDDRARYLPPPTKAPGLITGVNARGFYDFDTGDFAGNANIDFITGFGQTAFRADLFAPTRGTASLRSAAVTHVDRTRELTAGYLPYRSSQSLARSERLLGVRYGSTLQTRMDRAQISAAPVPVNIRASAVVEILRDDQILDIQRLEPGDTQIDTRRLPAGSYTITLRITEGSTVREERRFYSSAATLPPSGAPQWYVEAALPAPNASRGRFLPNPNDDPLIAAGITKRLTAGFAVTAQASVSKRDRYGELGITSLGSRHSLSAGIIASGDGDTGQFVRGSLFADKWRVSANYQEVRAKDPRVSLTTGPYDPFPISFRQASFNATYRFADLRVGARGLYRQSQDFEESYYIGPFLDWTVLRSRSASLTFSASYEEGNTRSSAFVGLRFNARLGQISNGRARSLAAHASHRRDDTKRTGERRTNQIAEAVLRYGRPSGHPYGATYLAGLRQEDDELGARGELRAHWSVADLGVDARYNYNGRSNALLSGSTALAIGGGGFAFTNRFQESGTFVTIDGPKDAQFTVLRDRSRAGQVSPGRARFVALPAFDIHDISIRPKLAGNLGYQHHSDRVVLYPGNIPSVAREAHVVAIVVGRVIGTDGSPLAKAAIYGAGLLAMTDDDGYFQLDLTSQKKLDVKRAGEIICRLDIVGAREKDEPNTEYLNLGVLICRK